MNLYKNLNKYFTWFELLVFNIVICLIAVFIVYEFFPLVVGLFVCGFVFILIWIGSEIGE